MAETSAKRTPLDQSLVVARTKLRALASWWGDLNVARKRIVAGVPALALMALLVVVCGGGGSSRGDYIAYVSERDQVFVAPSDALEMDRDTEVGRISSPVPIHILANDRNGSPSYLGQSPLIVTNSGDLLVAYLDRSDRPVIEHLPRGEIVGRGRDVYRGHIRTLVYHRDSDTLLIEGERSGGSTCFISRRAEEAMRVANGDACAADFEHELLIVDADPDYHFYSYDGERQLTIDSPESWYIVDEGKAIAWTFLDPFDSSVELVLTEFSDASDTSLAFADDIELLDGARTNRWVVFGIHDEFGGVELHATNGIDSELLAITSAVEASISPDESLVMFVTIDRGYTEVWQWPLGGDERPAMIYDTPTSLQFKWLRESDSSLAQIYGPEDLLIWSPNDGLLDLSEGDENLSGSVHRLDGAWVYFNPERDRRGNAFTLVQLFSPSEIRGRDELDGHVERVIPLDNGALAVVINADGFYDIGFIDRDRDRTVLSVVASEDWVGDWGVAGNRLFITLESDRGDRRVEVASHGDDSMFEIEPGGLSLLGVFYPPDDALDAN